MMTCFLWLLHISGIQRVSEEKSTAFALFRFRPDSAPVPVYNLFTYCKTDTRSRIFISLMQTLEQPEYLACELWGDTDSIVLKRNKPIMFFPNGSDMNSGFIFAVFDGIGYQVLKQPSILYYIASDHRQRIMGDFCMGFFYWDLQIGYSLCQNLI